VRGRLSCCVCFADVNRADVAARSASLFVLGCEKKQEPACQCHRLLLLGSSAHLTVILICLGFTTSAFGIVNVRMPFSNMALALSASTSVGRWMLRSNEL